MKRYLITCEETCPECKNDSEKIFGKFKVNAICSTCQGTGVVRKEVDLADVFDELSKIL